MIAKITIFIGIALIITACECVPGIETDRVKEPLTSANFSIINGIKEKSPIDADSDGNLIYEQLALLQDTEYKQVESGRIEFVSIYSDDGFERFINLPLNLTENEYYTLFLYRKNDEIKYRLLNDEYETGMANLRLNNQSSTNYSVRIISQTDTITSEFFGDTNSEFISMLPGDYQLEVFIGEDIFFQESFSLSSGYNANFICYTDDTAQYKLVKVNYMQN